MNKSKVLILYTGGTFGMVPEHSKDLSSNLIPGSLEDLGKYMPALEEDGFFTNSGVSITYEPLGEPKDSSDFVPADWILITKRIEEDYDNYDAFILIQGTDTMAYTASALSFMIDGLAKPIIITGSQLPISHPRTDAISNLTNSIYLAAYKSFDLENISEVLICFNDDLLRGNRATKYSTNDLEGFESPNFNSLASLEERIIVNKRALVKGKGTEFRTQCKMEDRVVIVPLFPGYSPNYLRNMVNDMDIKGIVFRAFGAGNYFMSPEFIEVLEEARAKEIIMLNTTQCYQGSVHYGKYITNKGMAECGVINGEDLTLEASITKMMWCLGNYSYSNAISILGSSIKGEMTN